MVTTTTRQDRSVERVLVVAWEEHLRRFLKEALRKAGYDVTVARERTEALRKARANRPGVVVLRPMSYAEWLPFVRELKSDPATAGARLVVLWPKSAAISTCVFAPPNVGIDGYLFLPLLPSELCKMLDAFRRQEDTS
jgi:DNA-binding response OmpR family regulator